MRLLAVMPLLQPVSTFGSLVPKIPGRRLISQLSNPWHWVSVLSLVASFVNLILNYWLHSNSNTQTGGTKVDIKVLNVPAHEERLQSSIEAATRYAATELLLLPICL